MDSSTIATIASTAVVLLVPYLKSVSEGFAKKAGEQLGEKSGELAWAKAKQLHQFIRTKFADDSGSEKALSALEETPDDSDTQAAVRFQLKDQMSADNEFAKQIAALLKEADKAGADTVFNTNIHGNVEKLVQMRDVYGDVNI